MSTKCAPLGCPLGVSRGVPWGAPPGIPGEYPWTPQEVPGGFPGVPWGAGCPGAQTKRSPEAHPGVPARGVSQEVPGGDLGGGTEDRSQGAQGLKQKIHRHVLQVPQLSFRFNLRSDHAFCNLDMPRNG